MTEPELTEHLELWIDDQRFDARDAKGREALSEIFRYEITCVVSRDQSPDHLVGKAAVLALRDRAGTERRVHGIVTDATIFLSDDGEAHARLTLRANVYALTVGRDCRTFRDRTVPQIVDAVLAGHRLSARWTLSRAYPARVYTAEYREDDWTFICRLLEAEGIYYWFDHESGSQLVMSDDSLHAPDVVGDAPTVPYVVSSGLTSSAEAIYEIGPKGRLRPTRFSIRSFDPGHPDLLVAGASGDAALEIYDAPGAGCTTSPAATHEARIQREGEVASRRGVVGRAQSVRLVPGHVVQVTDHPIDGLDGRYLVTACELEVARGRHGVEAGEAKPPHAAFQAISATVPFRSPRQTPAATHPGLQLGRVVGPAGAEIHPDEEGRVRVEAHWDRNRTGDDRSGRWLRIVQRPTAQSLLFPRVGWNVWTLNEEGSVDLPLVFSRAYDAAHPPPYGLPANKTRVTYRTLTTPLDGTANEIRFESAQGAEEMFLHATRDMSVLVNDRKSERIKANHARTVGVDCFLDVKENHDEHVVLSQTIDVQVDQREDVGAARQKSIGGDEIIRIEGARSLDVGGTISTDVLASRSLSVGTSQIDATLGDISMTSPLVNVVVGGAMIKVTAKGMQESVKGLSAQTIGGAKVELADKARTLEVDGPYAENVGGLMTLSSIGLFTDTADTSWSLSTTGPLTSSAGEDLVIEGTNSVTMKCGKTVITVTAASVEVSTPKLTLNGGAMTVKGNIKYN